MVPSELLGEGGTKALSDTDCLVPGGWIGNQDCGTVHRLTKRVVLIGPPGAGKNTQATLLTERMGVPHFSSGGSLREAVRKKTVLGLKAEPFLTAGRLVPDELIQSIMFQRIKLADAQFGFLLDGFPQTLSQARELQESLATRGEAIDLAVCIEASDDVLLTRLSQRGRYYESVDVIMRRLKLYREISGPVIDNYRTLGVLCEIDGAAAREIVFNRILTEIEYPLQPRTR